MRSIVVSGSSGFVGSNLVSFLNPSFQIKTIGRTGADYNWDDLDQVDGDAFIHLAAKAEDDKFSDASIYEEVNVNLTKQLFNVFLESQAELFIHFSSVKAVRDEVHGTLMEKDLSKPKTPYGKSKLKAEHYLQSQSLPEGKKLIILRPCMIHGPGNSGSLLQLYKFVNKGLPYPFAAFNNQRSFLAIDNLLVIVHEILHSTRIDSDVFNICDDEYLSTIDLIELIASVDKKKVKLLRIPKWFWGFLASIGDFLRLPFNSHILGKLTSDYRVSNQKLKDALGWESMPVKSEDGIRKTIKSFHK